jgi:uncharacterized membrane protein
MRPSPLEAVCTRLAELAASPPGQTPNRASQRRSKGAPGQAPSFFSALTKGGVGSMRDVIRLSVLTAYFDFLDVACRGCARVTPSFPLKKEGGADGVLAPYSAGLRRSRRNYRYRREQLRGDCCVNKTDQDLLSCTEDSSPGISPVHAEHRRRTPRIQRTFAAVTHALSRPMFIAVLTGALTSWVGLNLAIQASGRRAFDPPPFAYLSEAISVAALYLAAMILVTQSHEDELATHRDQLTLELAILNEQKSAKIIRLLEELRLNDPVHGNEPDVEAQAMAVPADPQAVLEQIRSISGETGKE